MATKPNRSERRSWDKYVKEARETFATVDLPDGAELIVHIPSADAVASLSEDDDLWTQVEKIMGADNAAKLRESAGDAPVTALSGLLADVMSDLGMSDTPGN